MVGIADNGGVTVDRLTLEPASQTRLDELTTKHWALPGDHALAQLHGRALGTYRMLVLLGAKNNVGSHYFQLYLGEPAGRLADAPVAFGLFNRGPYPGVQLDRVHAVQDVAELRRRARSICAPRIWSCHSSRQSPSLFLRAGTS